MEMCRVVQQFAHPAEVLWSLVSDFANPQRLATTIESCEVQGEGPGAIRKVRARGLTLHGRLLESDPVRLRFAYDVLPSGDMPAPGLTAYRVTVSIRPMGDGGAEVDWTCEVERDIAVDGGLERIAAGIIAVLKALDIEADKA